MKENIYNWSTGTTSTRDLSDAEVAERTLSSSETNTLNLRRLREERDLRLSETDTWALSDRSITAAQTKYRQDLRDLPANTSDPANPTWPTKP